MTKNYDLFDIKTDASLLLQDSGKSLTDPLVSIKGIRNRALSKANGGTKSIVGRYNDETEFQKLLDMKLA